MSATEVSVGLAGRLNNAGLPGGEPRGPRTWDSVGGRVMPRRDWTWPTFATGKYPFFAAPPPAPSEASPLNFVSVLQAKAMADGLGCRLPTATEWSRAYAFAGKPPWPTPGQNLRDDAWEAERQYLVAKYGAIAATGAKPQGTPWPDTEVFRVGGTASGAEARAVPGAKDGALFFQAVNQGAPARGFYHLIGNVAEFVGDGADFAVVGASALSPPEENATSPYPVGPALRAATFSDVGFRLAADAEMTGGGISPQDLTQLRRVLSQPPDLNP